MSNVSAFVNTNPELAKSYFLRPNMFYKASRRASATMTVYLYEGLFDTAVSSCLAYENSLTGQSYLLSPKFPAIIHVTKGYYEPVSLDDLANHYVLADGTPINEQTLKVRAKKNTKDMRREITVKYSPKECAQVYAACFVPRQYMFPWNENSGLAVNDRRIRVHGAGDFLVSPVVQGNIVTQRTQLLNGVAFEAMFKGAAFSEDNLKNLQKQAAKVLG